MIKTFLILFRLAQSICFFCKVGIELLQDLLCKSAWLNWSRIRLDQSKVVQFFFCRISNSAQARLTCRYYNKRAMVTKSSEDKQFRHQMITFNEEKRNLSPNIIKILKLVTKSVFRHQRCTNWIGDEINISSPKMYKLVMKYLFRHYRSWKKGKPRVMKYSRHQRLTRGDEVLNSSHNIRM